MGLGMNFNKTNNIKQAKASRPKKTFKDLDKSKFKKQTAPLTTIKIDRISLAKLDLIQNLLGTKKHENTLKAIIDKTLPEICKKNNVSKDNADFFIKTNK